MEITAKDLSKIIKEGINNSLSYAELKSTFEAVVANGKSTGNLPEDQELANYSKLTVARMKRLDKTLNIDSEIVEKIKSYVDPITWLVITESWCGDAGQTIPVINKFAELNEHINLRFVLRDENDELMNQFLTNGGKSIPKLIAFDVNSNSLKGSWGPRPFKATKLVNEFKEKHGKLTPEFKKDLQVWYNKDKGKSTVEDLMELL